MGGFGGDMGGGWSTPKSDPDDDVIAELIADAMPSDAARALLAELPTEAREEPGSTVDTGGDISASSMLAKAALVLMPNFARLETRLNTLANALEAVRGDRSFDRDHECKAEYAAAAETLLARDFNWVVFGHTHMARRVTMAGGVYLNTGTWADLITFPMELLDLPEEERHASLRDFACDLEERRFEKWVKFIPTFARLRLGDAGRIESGDLVDFTGPDSV